MITVPMLESLYQAFHRLEPFKKYRLPPAHKVKFRVTRSMFAMGTYDFEDDRHEITISRATCKTLNQVIETMLHEMTHLALEKKGCQDHSEHDSEYNALAAQVCDYTGLNFKDF